MYAFCRLARPDLGELGLELLTILGEFRLHRRRVLPVAVPSENLPIDSQDLFFMVLDVLESGLDVLWRQAKQPRKLIGAPALLYIIHDIIDGDARAGDFWPATTIDNLGSHGLLSSRGRV